MRLPSRPTVYELNTAVWLARLGRERGRALLLDEVPGSGWDALAELPVDAVWLMGVWERSPVGLQIALTNPDLDAGNRAALPDLRVEDVIGSPYCVRSYAVDERFGGPDVLAAARRQLAGRGLGLILDYVPNHVAPDHSWLTERPDCFIAAGEDELAQHPEAFIRTAGGIVANGRDPYFPPWPDVVQLNAFSPGLREAVAQTLLEIAAQCDGVRCDMAMLMTNEVFARTWGERAGTVPQAEYWPPLIRRVHAAHPDFPFVAEVYWDMEWTLQQQGFDLCYDKRLYDRLLHEPAESVRAHLQADPAYQERLIRFIENHDEPRAAAVFGAAQARAAAVVISTLQGARLYHDGQFDGFRTHIPVFLGRGPDEPSDPELRSFYERLIQAIAAADLRDGEWRLCECTGWPDNASTAIFTWGTACTAAIAFAVGFRLHSSALDGLAAFGLVVLFGFAFEWLFITMGLFAGNAQAAQGLGMIVFPFAFVSSAYVPVSSMPGMAAGVRPAPAVDLHGRLGPLADARSSRQGATRSPGLLLRDPGADVDDCDPRGVAADRDRQVPPRVGTADQRRGRLSGASYTEASRASVSAPSISPKSRSAMS